MHILCKYFFVRLVDLFAGPFNCLNFSLELYDPCLSPVFLFVCFSNIVDFCYVYELFLLMTI